MVESKDKEQAPEPLSAEEATEKSEAAKLDDNRYVGVDPIYKNSAYEEPLEVKAGRSKEDKEAVEGELEMLKRVKANEAGCVVQVDEPVPYEEWVGGQSEYATHQQGVRGRNEDQLKADRKVTEDAKDEDGKIPPRSGSLRQPGVPNAV